jgi:MFS family permease
VDADAGSAVGVAAQESQIPAVADGTNRHLPLWRNLQFQTLWIGGSMSTLGVAVADVAYPLAILAITGSPGRAGLFAAVLSVGMLACALPAGQLADRYDRRTVVVAAESCRALVTGVVAAGLIAGWLSLPILLLAAVLLGAGQSISGAARMPLVRSVVAPEQLTTALVQEEVRQSGAQLAGPPLAGALYAIRALAHAVPFLFTAASFLLALLAAVLMKVMPGGARQDPRLGAAQGQSGPGKGKPTAGEKDGGMLTGLRTIWSHPVLRPAMAIFTLVNTVAAGVDLIIIVLLRHQHVPSGVIGLVLASAALGSLAGAPLVKVLHRLRPGVLVISEAALLVAGFFLLALPFGPWWVAAILFLSFLAVPAMRVLLDVLVLRQVPDQERGRVIAAVMVLLGLGTPVGVSAAGLMLQYLSATTTMLVLGAVLALAVAVLAPRRTLLQARWPDSSSRPRAQS